MMSMIFRALGLSTLLVTAFLFSIPLAPPSPVHAALPFEVNTLTDQTDGSCGDGSCSLRDAITLANANAGADTIVFDVAGTITVSAALGCLPFLNDDDGTTIDGTTAPGYAAAGHPVVEITAGPGLDCPMTNGIVITRDNNTLTGLAIHSFADDCIGISSASGNVIGPDMVLSDCYWGINMGGPQTGNTIRNSFIGTNLDGDAAWGNVGAGIYLNHGPQVNGPTLTEILDNVISGNGGEGILLYGENTDDNKIQGNYIGVAADGVTPLGNGAAGIRIAAGSHDNYIGGALLGDPNIIAYNASVTPDTGIVITDEGSDGNRISHNSIYDNTDLGIDLGDDGVTCNSPSEDEPNDFLPCPVINSASTSLVSGTTCPNCIVEVFIADPDPSGYGEGRTYLGDTETTDGNFTVPVSGVSACDWLTATAIGQNEDYGNTSEFALNVQVPCVPQEQHHRRTPTPAPTRTATPAPTEAPLPPPPPPTAAPSGGVVPAVLPPATGEGPTSDGSSWLGPALLLGAGSALAIGSFYLRAPKGKRRGDG
jgi:CSLREA domain-containing protein